MHLSVSISSEISNHFENHIKDNPTDYVCVYGSSVYSPEKITSDVDMFIVTHGAGKIALSPFVEFIRDLHHRHGRKLDAEVPYENKVHYRHTELESAIQLGGFIVEGSKVIVPPIRKEADFLNSPEIKARLALNGLTTPHAVIGKNFSQYHVSRERSGEAITLLAIGLIDDEEFVINNLHEALTADRLGASGEMYLGYKTEYPLVREHLFGVLNGALDRLTKQSIIQSTNQGYIVNKADFDPLGYLKSTMPDNNSAVISS